MPLSTETHCSPRYSPLIVLYVLSARITATRIAANKSGKRRAETRRVYDLHRYYTRIIFHGSRTTDDRQTPTITRHRQYPSPRYGRFPAVHSTTTTNTRAPIRRRKYSERAKVFTTAFTTGAISSCRPAKSFSRMLNHRAITISRRFISARKASAAFRA